MSTNFLPFLIIPIPTNIPVGYGVNSTVPGSPNGLFIQCRGLKQEKELVQRAAAAIGMTYGGFMRRVVTDAANAVLYQMGQPIVKLPGDIAEEERNSTD